MKKIFTLIAAALMAAGVNAQTWSADAVTLPEVAEGETAKATVEAGTTLVDNALATVSTVYGATVTVENKDGIAFGSYSIKNQMQVRVAAWPTASVPSGTENAGSTSIKIDAKKDITVTVFYRRQAKNSAFTSGDGKDIMAYSGDASVGASSFEKVADKGDTGEYGYCTTSYALNGGKTYYLCAKGTTLAFMGFDLTEKESSSVAGPETYANVAAEKVDGFSTMSYPDGAKLILTKEGKAYANGLSITVDGATFLTTKNSNGGQNKFVAPEGKKIYKVTIYSYVNKDDAEDGGKKSYWKEVNGVSYTEETATIMKANKNMLDTPDAIAFDVDGVSEFTFNNAGNQLGFVLKVDYSVASGIQDINAEKKPQTTAVYNLAGQRVNANAKGIVIKNGKKVMQ